MDSEIIENFYGVYLLYCINPKYKGKTYIGFTTDPNRRVKQHNQGIRAGGARRTSNKGPWDMVLIVHGFPNEITALRFEWAWTYPQKSRRLKNLPKKKSKECHFDYCLRILGTMLQTKPWARFPLTLRWLKHEYWKEFLPGLDPPVHMPVAYGLVKPTKAKVPEVGSKERASLKVCWFCQDEIDDKSLMMCLSTSCPATSHVICLANNFLKEEASSLIPVEGTCPSCHVVLLWGDLVRQMKGCYQSEKEAGDDSHWADSLSQIS